MATKFVIFSFIDWTLSSNDMNTITGLNTVKSQIEGALQKLLSKREQYEIYSVLFWVTIFGVRLLFANFTEQSIIFTIN